MFSKAKTDGVSKKNIYAEISFSIFVVSGICIFLFVIMPRISVVLLVAGLPLLMLALPVFCYLGIIAWIVFAKAFFTRHDVLITVGSFRKQPHLELWLINRLFPEKEPLPVQQQTIRKTNQLSKITSRIVLGSFFLVWFCIVTFFIRDINAFDGVALQATALDGDYIGVRFVLFLGADVHADHDMALSMASAAGSPKVINLLLDHGANVHAENDRALWRAASEGHTDAVELLLNHGADIHAHQDMALFGAVDNGHTKTVKYLLDHGATALGCHGSVLLHTAEKKGYVDIMKLINDRRTPTDYSNKSLACDADKLLQSESPK